MAKTQNLFDKYGIKEVADVTFYRIEKKEETFESQRTITAASVLKGALELRTVYPINEAGVGEEDGFDAYVFTDAQLITGANYDCDDSETVIAKFVAYYDEKKDCFSTDHAQTDVQDVFDNNAELIVTAALEGVTPRKAVTSSDVVYTDTDEFVGVEIIKVVTDGSNVTKTPYIIAEGDDLATMISGYAGPGTLSFEAPIGLGIPTIVFKRNKETGVPVGNDVILANLAASDPVDATTTLSAFDSSKGYATAKGTINAEISLEFTEDLTTGVYNINANVGDASRYPGVGTHEFTYPQQVAMLFAKNQNLITKSGVRYVFENADTMFGEFDFNDNFAGGPRSAERVVVVGLAGKFDENAYDMDEIKEAFAKLTDAIEAKAYDVTYSDYAELVVEDEMGYYNPKFLGYGFTRVSGAGKISFFANSTEYIDYVGLEKADSALAGATMWGDGIHYSINDAIDALRQKRLVLDAGADTGAAGLANVFGGYLVSSTEDPTPGTEDTTRQTNLYSYIIDGTAQKHSYNNEDIKTKYPLEAVVSALNEIGGLEGTLGKEVRVDYDTTDGKKSNRAIYVKVNGAMDTSAGAYIYLLHNKNYNKLALDKDGIFKF